MKVTVWTYKFEAAHGKKPAGFGTWFFRIGTQEYPIVGKYSEAKKMACQMAKEKGVTAIYTLS